MKFSDFDIEEDFVEIGDDPIQCGSKFSVICKVVTEECQSIVYAGLDSIGIKIQQ